MAARFVPRGPFNCTDKKGIPRSFSPNHRRPDGTFGYTADEIATLDPAQKKTFVRFEVTGETVVEDRRDEPVEQATAAPGQKRVTKRSKPSE